MIRLATSFWVLACKFFFYFFKFVTKFIFRVKADDGYRPIEPDRSEEPVFMDFFWEYLFEGSGDYTTGIGETEDSVSMESCLASNMDKYQVLFSKDFRGFMEVPETKSFTVQEFIMGSNDDASIVGDGSQDIPVSGDKDSPEFHPAEADDSAQHSDQTIHPVSAEQDFCELYSKAEAVLVEKAEDSIEGLVRKNDSENIELAVLDLCVREEILSLEIDHSGENMSNIQMAEDSAQSLSSESDSEKPETVVSTEQDFCENTEIRIPSSENSRSNENNSTIDIGFLSEHQFPTSESEFGSDHDPSGSAHEASISCHKVDLATNECFPENHGHERVDFLEKTSNSEEICTWDKAKESDGACIELVPSFQSSNQFHRSFSREEMEKAENNNGHGNSQSTESELIDDVEQSEEVGSPKKSWDYEYEDDDEFDVLLKHQDMIEQMKTGMKNARAKGLPTILEECESPKMAEDLGPLKFDEKLEHKDQMKEIQKVYKGYAEKMRKLDILNYQTLHAISFLQLKGPVELSPGQNSSPSGLKSLPFSKLWTSKSRRIYADPTLKSMGELHKNLEMVYVGQVCLSWEILYWQYGKAKELLQHDCQGHGPYNQVAGEFQQFQVLVQRFIENEAFQGPRVQNYAKHRCELRTLLQVPAIREDCLRDKKDIRAEGEGGNEISMAMLREIIDESIRLFWDFLHADRDEANMILKGLQVQATDVDLQDPSDYELFMDTKTSLQKKEKRLKDIVRSGNCIVKKFQKHRQGRMDKEHLFALFELKIVSRVLNMPRKTTEQLAWCQKKLNKINVNNRKLLVQVEPSFLPFPF